MHHLTYQVAAASTTLSGNGRHPGGRRQYLWRAVDEDGDVLDILVQSRRNRRAAAPVLPEVAEEPGLCVLDEAQTLPPGFLAPILETLDELVRHYGCSVVLRAVIMGGGERDPHPRELRAAVGHAVSFSTWSSLTQENGLPQDAAVSQMAGLIEPPPAG